MRIPFKDLIQMSKDYSQVWPPDLVTDLEEEEPLISLQSETYHKLISEYVKDTEIEEVPRLPTLVVAGWDNPIKGKKNWADFENLLLFYTIGELAIDETPENQLQKGFDLTELRAAIESFLPLKGQKKKSAERRVAVDTTYLAFAKRVIDGMIKDDPFLLHDIRREIQESEGNYYNQMKLERSYDIASRVFKKLTSRYQRQG